MSGPGDGGFVVSGADEPTVDPASERETITHPYELLTDPTTGHAVEIDERLVPVILRLWADGIRTCWSCQGAPNTIPEDRAYITFPTMDDVAAFLDLFGAALGLDDRDYVLAGGVSIIAGSFPEGFNLIWPDVYLDASAVREDDGWHVEITARFRNEVISRMVGLAARSMAQTSEPTHPKP